MGERMPDLDMSKPADVGYFLGQIHEHMKNTDNALSSLNNQMKNLNSQLSEVASGSAVQSVTIKALDTRVSRIEAIGCKVARIVLAVAVSAIGLKEGLALLFKVVLGGDGG